MTPRKILIIRFSSLGDIILTTPIYRNIKEKFPEEFKTITTEVIKRSLERKDLISEYKDVLYKIYLSLRQEGGFSNKKLGLTYFKPATLE